MKKRILALFLSIAMVFSFVPFSAFAAEGDTAAYVKVTEAPDDWSGDYLIVYEAGNLAFNGGLTTLDAVKNTVAVTITNGRIDATDAMNAAKVTIAKSGSNYTIKTASGYFIGQTADGNKLLSNKTTQYTNTIAFEGTDVKIVASGKSVLRYNATSGQERFRYFKSGTYLNQKAIALYKYTVVSDTTDPEEPVVPACTHENFTVEGAVEAELCKAGYTGDKLCLDCDEIFEKGTVIAPLEYEADSELTFAEAIALGLAFEHDNYSTGKFYLTGKVTEVTNTQYGNMTIADEEGNTFSIYGLYKDSTRYDAMEVKPLAGDTVKVYGIVGKYGAAAQMKNAQLIELTVDPNREPEPEPEEPTGKEATITFNDVSKMTSDAANVTTEQTWEENGIRIDYVKGSYTNDLAKYANPIRFYKGTEVTISYPNMKTIVVEANTTAYATALAGSAFAPTATAVADGKIVTITLAEAASALKITMGAQVRVNYLTVYAAEGGDEPAACTHANTTLINKVEAACGVAGYTGDLYCPDCEETLETGSATAALEHDQNTVIAGKDATCEEDGLTEGKNCSKCGTVQVAQEKITALGHSFTEFLEKKEPTYNEAGYETYKCVRCDETKTTTLAILEGAVAEINGVKYGTLEEAFKNVANGGTITIIDDIAFASDLNNAAKGVFNIADGMNITLDLNGKTITVTDNSKGNFIVFYNYGEFTVKDSVGTGKVELTATIDRAFGSQSTIILNRGGVLTIEGGLLEHKGGDSMAITVDNSGNSFGDAYMYVNGGEIKSTYIAIRMRMADTTQNGNPGNGIVYTEVNGGYIYGVKRGIWGQITNAYAGELGTLMVVGGTVESELQGAIHMTSDGNANIDVIISDNAIIKGTLVGEGADYAIAGGTFTVAVPKDFCAEGFQPKENEDGTFGVELHVHNYEKEVTAPTCTEDGYTTYTCACGDTYVADVVKTKGHRYNKTQVFTFCEEYGYVLITCGNCGKTFKSGVDAEADQYLIDVPFFKLDAKGHNMVAGEVIAPTADESGYTVYTCANGCGETEEKDFVMPLDSEVKNVQATQIDGTMDLKITWNAIKGASAYFVYVYDANGTRVRGTTITNGKNSARLNGFEAGNYTVKVRAQVGDDYTAKYDAVAVKFISLYPTAPTATIVETTKTSITVKWDAVYGAKIYYVRFVSAEKTFLRVVNAVDGKAEYEITRTGLAVNTEYKVSICVEYGESEVTGYGEKVTAMTKDYADVALTATKTTNGIAVAWNVSNDNGVTAVWVQRVNENGKSTLIAAEYSATGEVLTKDLEGDDTFYIIVEVMNDYGQARYVKSERVTA